MRREEWRQCFGGFYAVSNRGRVRRELAGQGTRAGYVLKKQRNVVTGYEHVGACIDGQVTTMAVHVLVAQAFIGPRPTKMDVNHRNGNKCDNRSSNLEYISRSDNHLHAYRIGIRKRVGSKLTEKTAGEIRRRRASGEMLVSIAKSLGVSKSHVSSVALGKRWKVAK